MSAYSDSLPPGQRAAYFAACKEAGRMLAIAYKAQAELYRREGSRAVAEAAWYPGHPLGTVEAIEARFLRLLEEARREQERTAGGSRKTAAAGSIP